MRRAHFLRENKGTELPNSAIWVDTETKPKSLTKGLVSHHLFFGWACFSRTRALDDWIEPIWTRFEKPYQFWDWVESVIRPKTRTYMFAHNWGFDAPVLDLFNELPKRGWKLSKAVIDGPPIILNYRKDDTTILCLDTLNWWRMKLEAIGTSLGLTKLPMPGSNASTEEWDTYCKRDVEITYRVMREWWRFLRTHDLGSFGPTLASQAIRAFRHRFMDHEILIDDNPKALALSREALHGGRVECFRIGRVEGPITVLDVNSMYPFVMRDNTFPAKLLFHTTKFGLGDLTSWLKSRSVVARVRLQTKRAKFAVVRDGRLIFPTGRFVTVLTSPELIDAIQHSEIHSVIEASVYTAEPIFQRFVSTFYKLRQKSALRSDPVSTWLIKILMNSLYGKFAQRGNVWETIRPTDDLVVKQWIDYDFETGAIRNLRQFGGIVQAQSRETEAFDSFPAIAAHVTAYARQLLHSLRVSAGLESCLYVDTDSLYIAGKVSDDVASLINPSALGGLKVEGVHDWIKIHGPKDYELPNKTVIKGIRGNATKTGPNSFEQEQFSSLVGLLNVQDMTAPRIKQISKTLSRRYLKGQVTKTGKVLPFRLSDW